MNSPEMTIKEMFLVVKDLNAELLASGDETFKRVIKFVVNGVPCWIEWWKNVSYLSIGTRYANQIPFICVKKDDCWPFYRNGLNFCNKENEVVCYLAIKMLDWQEQKEARTP